MTTPIDAGEARAFGEMIAQAKQEIHKVIVGQDELVDLTLQCVFCHAHALLQGVPGLAKTLLVTSIAQALGVVSKRIQFTPDLMPSDITGSEIIQEDPTTGRKQFVFQPGPIFANLVLADEINRTPPKTQAALLEAMQERQVSVGSTKHKLEAPFFVLATQNPIEQEGTYTLPEAQLDRFMYLIVVDYPELADEIEVLRRTTTNHKAEPEKVFDAASILRFQKLLREVVVREDLYDYVVRLVRGTRVGKEYGLATLRDSVAWGAGPRACQNLVLGAKARAFFAGRAHITTDDIRAVAKPVLRHRVSVSYAAAAERITSDLIVERLLKEIPAPAERSAHG
jgi:MoxR-like ATPase